jgi:aspartyl-tRNA(Asn)/glutamyl-tRNA(Gln) amidotransferase subunit B
LRNIALEEEHDIMSDFRERYELVIGLEVHAQLMTKSKAYSSDPNEYGSLPNSNISPISLGHPGTLPRFNRKAVELAIRFGLASGCEITRQMHFARKNYFYPDLPKGYQITQDTTPICTKGIICIRDEHEREKNIGITRAHLEEDAGKSIHDQDPFDTLVDLNRAGVPLIEIVSEPDIRSSAEAYNYLTVLRQILKYLDICDGNMEEGSLRCDANVSIRPRGQKEFRTRAEVKNLNSFRNVQRAIEFEYERQAHIIDNGGEVFQETRTFDAATGRTISMRSKEKAHDYRYFPEPDLGPLVVSDALIERVKSEMPELPEAMRERYIKDFGLSAYDAGVLTAEKDIALYFEEVFKHCGNAKAAANWVTGEVKSYLNKNAVDIDQFPMTPGELAGLIALVLADKVSFSAASSKILPVMIESKRSAEAVAESLGMIQNSDESAIKDLAAEVLAAWPDKVAAYKSGNKGLLGLFMGEFMKKSNGKANPKVANQIIKELLEQ